MNKTQIIAILFIVLLIGGIVYYETTRDKYRADKLHWQAVMKDISSNETKTKLISHFNNSEVHEDFISLLIYLRQHVLYMKEDFPRSEDPEWIIWSLHLGRCGEFSIAYTALLLAFDIPARLVVFIPYDHMITQVSINETWISVDPTEGRINQPYLYEESWYIPERGYKDLPLHDFWAFNVDGTMEDVTEMFQR